MSTISHYPGNQLFSTYRAIVESCFYGNNVKDLPTVQSAYHHACQSPGTIQTNIPLHQPLANGFPADATILVFNDGEVVGRSAQSRVLANMKNLDIRKFSAVLREAAYEIRFHTMYHCQAIIGLHENMMIKGHLLISRDFENLALNWMINFQPITPEYQDRYTNSQPMEEPDILLISYPQWKHPDFPLGLAFFDPDHNCGMLLGMRYFGEHKKGTLTLGWNIANRNGYAACHGGLKRYDDNQFVLAAFGLSGSGKSTITHSRHNGKYDITILHDDAFVINTGDFSSIAMEPTYFDKTSDYQIGADDNQYILTAQNVGVSQDSEGHHLLVTEDIRNANGRAIKSRFWSPKRIDYMPNPINAICWLMKDPTLPPVIKLTDPVLASVMGATLATKRTSAERVSAEDMLKLVVEPYANPFRTYPLQQDYFKFKQLIENGISCYILNTGDFMGRKVTKEITIGIIEKIVEGNAEFIPWPPFENFMQIMDIEGFIPDMNDQLYVNSLRARFQDRLDFIRSRATEQEGFDALPAEAEKIIQLLIQKLH